MRYEADINKDGHVGLADFIEIVFDWLKCTNPAIEGCFNLY